MGTLIGIGKALTPRNVLLAVITHNMIARPAITLSNNSLPEDTKRYTASREFCTELFGLINTLTFTTFVEWLGPRLADRNATAGLINRVKSADWSKLSQKNQHLKAVILMSSLIGSAMSCGILTPLLNNIVLNRVLDKIGCNKTHQNKGMPNAVQTKSLPNSPVQHNVMPNVTHNITPSSTVQNSVMPANIMLAGHAMPAFNRVV